MAQRIIETEWLKAWRAREAINPNPPFVIDGAEFAEEDANMVGDGQFAPFGIFDTNAQTYLLPFYSTRAEAETRLAELCRKAIVIERDSRGWFATFFGVENMPSGEPLPLPFTSLSTEAAVRAHMVAHFPGASVRALHSL